MVKVTIQLEKEIYEVLHKIEKHMEALVNYLDNLEIVVTDEKEVKTVEWDRKGSWGVRGFKSHPPH